MPNTHTVNGNDGIDSLWKMAKHYGVSFAEIKKLNPQIMGRYPVGHPRHGWVFDGDVVKLPPKLAREGDEVRKTKEDCKDKKLKVIAVAPKTDFKLCEPAVFRVTSYDGSPTEADKGRIKWMIRNARDKADLSGTAGTKITAKKDELIIDCVPYAWRGMTVEVAAQFDKKPNKKMVAKVPISAEVYDWIAMIEKAEAAYPALTGVQMTNAMRRIAGYDSAIWQKMLGGSPAGATLTPSGALTAADIKQLETWTKHSGPGKGVVKDSYGDTIAAGHVLTGISGGVYRNKSIDITGTVLPAGETMDNLYAVTISGDLGQVAVMVNAGKQKKPYLGSHGDAEAPELRGDLDGFNIGFAQPKGGSGRRLSQILLDYYCACNPTGTFHERVALFQTNGQASLQDQVIRFASVYVYKTEGKLGGLFSEITTESKEATVEFFKWMRSAKVTEQNRAKVYAAKRKALYQ